MLFEKLKIMGDLNLKKYGIECEDIFFNPPSSLLYEEAIKTEPGSRITESGALIAYSGKKTGRSPKDKRIVKEPATEKDIWWGSVNYPLEKASHALNRQRAIDYLNTRERLYVVDGFAGWDPKHRIKIRTICARPYHALFMRIMLIKPSAEELQSFGTPDYTIYNAGPFPANRLTQGLGSSTAVDLSFEDHDLVILGTEYAGEMKKGVFTIMNYLMPKNGLLSMHSSVTVDPLTDKTSLLFGLSGTGKTTLSADPKRRLLGDDEHVWSEDGIFNIEGGCYAKTANLTPESEPEIFSALHFGAILENVVFDDEVGHVDYSDVSITENTRGAYPLEFIKSAKIPAYAGHPTDIIFLTCDAFGVLPPVSRLNQVQTMYHFLSGYTAKVAGTEIGVKEPTAAFSACFGAPFLVWPPTKYATLLDEKMRKHKVNVWLINTGWSGGGYGVGKRIKLAYTRSIIDAIHSGELAKGRTEKDAIFGLNYLTECSGVPSQILTPRETWSDKSAYDQAARKLAALFEDNYRQFTTTL
jgi:phosphoenolpyruvate carboxykinase (ATP)